MFTLTHPNTEGRGHDEGGEVSDEFDIAGSKAVELFETGKQVFEELAFVIAICAECTRDRRFERGEITVCAPACSMDSTSAYPS